MMETLIEIFFKIIISVQKNSSLKRKKVVCTNDIVYSVAGNSIKARQKNTSFLVNVYKEAGRLN